MSSLTLITRPDADTSLITVVGPLDRWTCRELQETGSRLLGNAEQPRALVVNLRCCTCLDRDGLATLRDLDELARASGVEARLAAVPPLLDHLLRADGWRDGRRQAGSAAP